MDKNNFIKTNIFRFKIVYMYVFVLVSFWCLWKPEEVLESAGTGITDGCEPRMGAGNPTWVLCKSKSALHS